MHEKPQMQQEMIRGRTVQEIAEMSDMRRADTNAIKAYMSRTHDRARGAYGHDMVDQPRRLIYVGTTNEFQYLPDEENRRFYPFKAGVFDLTALVRDRDQLHAEAVAAVWMGEDAVVPRPLWATAAKEQKKRRIADDWEDVIGEALRVVIDRNATNAISSITGEYWKAQVREIDHKGRRVWFISSAAILTDILEIKPAQQRGSAGRRVHKVMGRLGWECIQAKIGGHVIRGFIFDIAAKGIGAGEWDRYRDALDVDGDDEGEDGDGASEASTTINAEDRSDGATSKDEDADSGSHDGEESYPEGDDQGGSEPDDASDRQGGVEDEDEDGAIERDDDGGDAEDEPRLINRRNVMVLMVP
jgi:hypothetical protein